LRGYNHEPDQYLRHCARGGHYQRIFGYILIVTANRFDECALLSEQLPAAGDYTGQIALTGLICLDCRG
jgi:hypothetical protein